MPSWHWKKVANPLSNAEGGYKPTNAPQFSCGERYLLAWKTMWGMRKGISEMIYISRLGNVNKSGGKSFWWICCYFLHIIEIPWLSRTAKKKKKKNTKFYNLNMNPDIITLSHWATEPYTIQCLENCNDFRFLRQWMFGIFEIANLPNWPFSVWKWTDLQVKFHNFFPDSGNAL